MFLDVTVCIPLNDPKLKNEKFLVSALDSLVAQSQHPRQVVLTSSESLAYLSDLPSFYNRFFEVTVAIKATNGASMNFNNSVSLAKGSVVQLLCQDDFISNRTHLANVAKKLLRSDRKWMVSGSVHFEEATQRFSRKIRPKFNLKLLDGVNSIGAPSVAAFRRSAFKPFDVNLHYMYDCDWYIRMYHTWGLPITSKRSSIGIRIHENQSTHEVSALLGREKVTAASSHFIDEPSNQCICARLDGHSSS
jgi:hypothetical protein